MSLARFAKGALYDPFEDDYDEGRISVIFRGATTEDFAILLQRFQLQERIENYYARGYLSNQEVNAGLPEVIRRVILVSQRALFVSWLNEEKLRILLPLHPPIFQGDIVEEMQYIAFANRNSILFHLLIRNYTVEEWRPLVTDHVQFSIGVQGDVELLDVLLENGIQPSINMLQGAILYGRVDIIDRIFAVHEGDGLRPLHADRDNMVNPSLFVYAIDARDTEGNSTYNKDVMQRLLMYGTNPNGNGIGQTPLEQAFYTSNADAVEELLSYGANPNMMLEGFNVTLLMYAVKAQAPLFLIRLLVQSGADVDAVVDGKKAVFFATGETRGYLLPLTTPPFE